ncbi:ABC transporter permease subunit [Clostridium tetanomorphum]|uniref:ABC transporter permease subunit n=2 Tax=Clostridium tetanomorphum TaxID=1553 RepID=A0A923IZP8_CLOTT|nr:ABC transporter permease subunit [Clostridium tetanomorphum]
MIIGKKFTPYDPNLVDMSIRLQSPSAEHILGTDNLGRDVFSRVLAGAWTTVGTGIIILMLSLLIGIPIGLLSGYVGGRIDWIIMRFIDAFLAFPDYIVAIVLSGVLGSGTFNLILAIVAVKWVRYARLVRSTVKSEKMKDYIFMAKLNGMGTISILGKHLIPHVLGNVMAVATMDMGKIIIMIASLSYIGLGVQPPNPEWGSMLNEGRTFFQSAPYLMIAPGLAIVIVVLAVNLFGDSIGKQYSTNRQKR